METGEVLDSMDLKVNEFLEGIKLEYSPEFTKFVDDTVTAVKLAINGIPDGLQVTADEAPEFIRDIGADAGKVSFTFKKPDWIGIGGSYAIQSVAKPDVGVDLLLRLPKECFYEKDYLDHRYHGKRFLYLCVIKNYLMSCRLVDKVEWSALQNEARKPILVVYPALQITGVPPFCMRIIATARNVFSFSHLRMGCNNIRSLKKDEISEPTPIYNSSILEDMSMEDTLETIQKIFNGWKELRDALILLKVWTRQRCSLAVHDCLNGYLLAVILSYLVFHEKINKLMKPMQIFRLTMTFIAKSKLWSQVLYLQKKNDFEIPDEEKLYKRLFPVTIFGFHVNITFRISRSGFSELREEASKTLNFLENFGEYAFEDVMMKKVDFAAKFDHCIRLDLKGVPGIFGSGFCLDTECWRLYEKTLENLLSQGLNDRAKLIRVMWRNIPSSYCINSGLSYLDKNPLYIGILLSSSEKATRIVDIGPPAENKEEALSFRKFWGEKAELRRFKDGNIAESTVWDCDQHARHLILKQIIDFLLARHMRLSVSNIVQVVDQLDFSLLHGAEDPMSRTANLLEAFDTLSMRLRSIDDIPLRVSSVQALDPAFRFTSVFPPEPHHLANGKRAASRTLVPSCIEPVEVMIQLESSGYWPEDTVSIEITKLSFLLLIAESLKRSFGMNCSASRENVEVFLSGYAFRLKIMLDKGGSFSAKQTSSIDRKLFFRAQHASMINGLQGRYPTYGSVVRLAKRWVNSHLFSACLADEAVELLVAYLYVKPFPFSAPLSRITGFLRFLRLLAEHDWKYSALIVDVNDDINQHDRQIINDRFVASRKDFKGDLQNICPAMFVATAYDQSSEAWTATSPNSIELKRMAAYARSSANFVAKLVEEDQPQPWESVFRTPLQNYDAIVLLHGHKLSYPRRLLFPSDSNQGKLVAQGTAAKSFRPLLSKGDREDKLMVDFSPLRSYVSDLKKEVDAVNVWYDGLGGDVIGLTWRDSFKKRQRADADVAGADAKKLLKSVAGIGKGLVKRVYMLKPPMTT